MAPTDEIAQKLANKGFTIRRAREQRQSKWGFHLHMENFSLIRIQLADASTPQW